jgi:hypothetical protein
MIGLLAANEAMIILKNTKDTTAHMRKMKLARYIFKRDKRGRMVNLHTILSLCPFVASMALDPLRIRIELCWLIR